ncbi:unnamed protein product [Pelagomonas calceolata]|uniref:PDZ domain-containing protein n=1 Tax=Pelagomonas calceolata TaxID=35677 RepID=A0A7S4E704_9STRA|nr:unnamed protein product [Pelagomonas calceolata]
MAAAPLALDKRGLRLRDANRPLTAPNKQRVVGLEVTPDKAPTLRGARPAPAVGFYAWATPHKKQQPRTRAISHPALREPISKATPLSQAVRAATARRDASIGDAYRAKHAALRRQNRLFDLRFDDAKLGFKICLGRRSVDARRRSTRRRVLVDETFPSCQAFDRLRPHDELVAINGALLIEVDAEAFASLVERLRTLPRPLTLTFAAGEGRERAFALQLRRRAAASSLVQTAPLPVASLPSTPPPRRRRQAADEDAERTQCGLTCFGSAYVCA